MSQEIRDQINKVIRLNEALKTACQTSGAIFDTKITDKEVSIKVSIPFSLELDKKEATLLEANIHNALELVLKPYFINK